MKLYTKTKDNIYKKNYNIPLSLKDIDWIKYILFGIIDFYGKETIRFIHDLNKEIVYIYSNQQQIGHIDLKQRASNDL